MRGLWQFLQTKKNREILAWLGGGVVVVAGGLWLAVTWFFPQEGNGGGSSSSATAGPGGVAVGRDNPGTIINQPPTGPQPPAR